ncbi:hypothetical protein MalM25_27000 [Planctomycetes bacterium MalM25]|nr:hypothetical protein MalM25_27000 [Planctomycetes bacterium MalM25]
MSEPKEKEAKKSSGLMGLVKAVVIICVLVVVEMVGATMMIPSAEETEQLARELVLAANGQEAIAAEDAEEAAFSPDDETFEVILMSDSVTRFNPETDATLNVQFTVYGVGIQEERDLFNEQFESNKSRVHEQINLTIHGASTSDLASANLGLIKRQILEKTNRTLGRPLLREVGFTKVNFIER